MTDNETRAQRIALAAKAVDARKKDVIDVRQPPKAAEPMAPTPEQTQHADYALAQVLDKGRDGWSIKLGKAFQRQARFESIEGLTTDQLRALRHYRRVFDQSEMSEIKSALDIRPRGNGDGQLARLEALIDARSGIVALEKRLHAPLLPVLRAVALHDIDFKQLAIERFGSREVERIDSSGKRAVIRRTIEPRSGRHRAIIRDEFIKGADALTASLRTTLTAAAQSAADRALRLRKVEPAGTVDPAFLDERGIMLEMDEIAAIILDRMYQTEGDSPEQGDVTANG